MTVAEDGAFVADHCDAWRSDTYSHGLGLAIGVGALGDRRRLLLGAPCGWGAEPDACDNGIYVVTDESPRVLGPADLAWWDREGVSGFSLTFAFVGDVTGAGATLASSSLDGLYLFTDVPSEKTQIDLAQRPALPIAGTWAAGAQPFPCGDVDGDSLTDLCTTQSYHRLFRGPLPLESSEDPSFPIAAWAELALPAASTNAVTGQFGEQRSLVFGMHTLDQHRGGLVTATLPIAGGQLQLDDVRWSGPEVDSTHALALSVGDADADGDDDLVLSSGLPDRRGSVTVLVDVDGDDLGGVLVALEGEEPGRRFGYATLLHDLDDDGHAELIVSAPFGSADDPSGEVYIFPGPIADATMADAIRWRAYSPAPNDFGTSLAAADLDGDGLTELYVGAPGDDFAIFHGGAVFRIRDPMRSQAP